MTFALEHWNKNKTVRVGGDQFVSDGFTLCE